MRLWCFALIAVPLIIACSDGGATPDLPVPDAGVDAAPGPVDAVPEDDNAVGRSCARAAGDGKGDCPSGHLCVGPDGGSWCTIKCDGEDGVCRDGFDGTGSVTCSLSLEASPTQMLVCAARVDNRLGAACTVSATSSQGDCAIGHLCVADSDGASTGTCTFKCDSDTACASNFTGDGEATCSNQITQRNGNAAPVTIRVCSVRASSALGRACTRTGTSSQGDCPDGHLCAVGTDGADGNGWCTFPCDAAADRCADGYQGPGEPFCSYAFLGDDLTPICAIACTAGPDRPCTGSRCNQTCPADGVCRFELLDFGPAGDQFPPRDYGLGCD